jgi:hypothetical protein
MIFDEKVKKNAGFFAKGWVERFLRKRLKGNSQTTLQYIRVARCEIGDWFVIGHRFLGEPESEVFNILDRDGFHRIIPVPGALRLLRIRALPFLRPGRFSFFRLRPKILPSDLIGTA